MAQRNVSKELSDANLIHDFNPTGLTGVMNDIVEAPLSVLGMVDRDFPFARAKLRIKNGVARIESVKSLDDPKGDRAGDRKARDIGQFVVDRINEVNRELGIYGDKSQGLKRFSVGFASGRKGSGLGKGLYIDPTSGSGFASDPGEIMNSKSIAGFAESLDKYLSKIQGLDFDKLPAYGVDPFEPPQIGKIDNTSPIAKAISRTLITSVITGGVGTIASSVATAAGASLETAATIADMARIGASIGVGQVDIKDKKKQKDEPAESSQGGQTIEEVTGIPRERPASDPGKPGEEGGDNNVMDLLLANVPEILRGDPPEGELPDIDFGGIGRKSLSQGSMFQFSVSRDEAQDRLSPIEGDLLPFERSELTDPVRARVQTGPATPRRPGLDRQFIRNRRFGLA